MSGCPTTFDWSSFHLRQMDADRERELREHLQECESCRAAYERFVAQSEVQTVAGPVRSGPVPGPARVGPSDDGSAFIRPVTPGSELDTRAQHFPKIEGYRILSVLGQGGMGIVYRAVQTNLNRTVALKVLPAIMGSASPNAVARFRREATSAARLHHTNIIAIHDFGESRDAYYYAMDLIVGQPLNTLIRRLAASNAQTLVGTKLDEIFRTGHTEVMPASLVDPSDHTELVEEAPSASTASASSGSGRGRVYYRHVARWMADTADALHYAHSQGIIHRDIKPGNLILSSQGRIMVADFGLAKTVDEDSVTMTGAMVGSLRYVSPEQAMAKRVKLDHRTDIFSLGATMYELLCFQPAFPGVDEKEVLGKILSRDPMHPRKLIPAVPAELDTICLKCLEKSPDSRYATSHALAEDLRRYLNDLPIAAKRPGPIKRVIKFVRRHKAPVVAVTAVLLLVTMGTLWSRERTRGRIARMAALCEEAENFARLEDWRRAKENLQLALRMDPESIRTLMTFAWFELEHYKAEPATAGEAALLAADRHAAKVIAREPNNVRALGYRGVALRRLGRYPDAIAVLQQALKIESGDFFNWSNLGVLYVLNKDLVNGEKYLTEGVKRAGAGKDRWKAAVVRNLASFELFRRDPRAVEHITQALDANKDDLPSWILRARSWLELADPRDPQKALDDAKYGDRLANFKSARAKRALATAYLRSDDFPRAMDEARAALKLGDLGAVNHLIIAVAQARSGAMDEASLSLAAAEHSWPEALRNPGDYVGNADTGELWIDTADDLLLLRDELRESLGEPTTRG